VNARGDNDDDDDDDDGGGTATLQEAVATPVALRSGRTVKPPPTHFIEEIGAQLDTAK
jgi:hypothetical protein